MRRFSPVIRWGLTTVLVGVCALVCAGFWLTVRQEDHSILGRYSMQWFIIALCASLVVGVLVYWRVCGHFRTPLTASHAGLPLGKKLLFSAITLVPILIIVEVALRLTLFAVQLDEEPRLMTLPTNYHALLQVTDRKQVDGRWVRAYRGKVYDRAKSKAFRIVCLGGSTTYGHNLRPESAWPAVTERLLRERGYDVEVINAGMPWYATAHSLANYVLQMRYYEPDVVVVMHGVNDLCRSFPKFGEPDPELDYGSYQGPLYLALGAARRESSPPGRRPQLLAGSALWTLVCAATNFNRYYYSALRERWGRSPSRRKSDPKANEAGEFDFTPADYPSIESFETHLSYLVEACRRDGRRVILGTQAHIYGRDTAEGDAGPRHLLRRSLFRVPGGVVSPASLGGAMRAIREAVFEIAGQHGVPVADAEEAIDSRPQYFQDDFHLTVAGHEVVAGVFASQLGPMLDDIRASKP